MNPQVTMARTIGPDPAYFAVSGGEVRTVAPVKRSYAAPVRIESAPIETAERDRLDSLTFLHKLVMG